MRRKHSARERVTHARHTLHRFHRAPNAFHGDPGGGQFPQLAQLRQLVEGIHICRGDQPGALPHLQLPRGQAQHAKHIVPFVLAHSVPLVLRIRYGTCLRPFFRVCAGSSFPSKHLRASTTETRGYLEPNQIRQAFSSSRERHIPLLASRNLAGLVEFGSGCDKTTDRNAPSGASRFLRDRSAITSCPLCEAKVGGRNPFALRILHARDSVGRHGTTPVGGDRTIRHRCAAA